MTAEPNGTRVLGLEGAVEETQIVEARQVVSDDEIAKAAELALEAFELLAGLSPFPLEIACGLKRIERGLNLSRDATALDQKTIDGLRGTSRWPVQEQKHDKIQGFLEPLEGSEQPLDRAMDPFRFQHDQNRLPLGDFVNDLC
jgi:hypothetical protein